MKLETAFSMASRFPGERLFGSAESDEAQVRNKEIRQTTCVQKRLALASLALVFTGSPRRESIPNRGLPEQRRGGRSVVLRASPPTRGNALTYWQAALYHEEGRPRLSVAAGTMLFSAGLLGCPGAGEKTRPARGPGRGPGGAPHNPAELGAFPV